RIAELSGEVDVLARQVPYHVAESSDVTARMREALDKSYAKRVADVDEYYRNRRSLTFCCYRCAGANSYKDFFASLYQLHQGLRILVLVGDPDHVEYYVPPLDQAGIA